MSEFKVELTQKEYLEIKKSALLDREKYASELNKGNPDSDEALKARDVILDHCNEAYEGDKRRAYDTNFLIPNDNEFEEFYHNSGSRLVCQKHFKVPFATIQDKFFWIKSYGKYDNLDEVEKALNSLTQNENGVEQIETLDLPTEETKEVLEENTDEISSIDNTHKFFSPLDHIEEEKKETSSEVETKETSTFDDERKVTLEKLRQIGESKIANEKIIIDVKKENDMLKKSNDELMKEIQDLKIIKQQLEENIADLSAKVIGLEEENKVFKAAYREIKETVNRYIAEEETTKKIM